MAATAIAPVLDACKSNREVTELVQRDEPSHQLARTLSHYAMSLCVDMPADGRYLLLAVIDSLPWSLVAEDLKHDAPQRFRHRNSCDGPEAR